MRAQSGPFFLEISSQHQNDELHLSDKCPFDSEGTFYQSHTPTRDVLAGRKERNTQEVRRSLESIALLVVAETLLSDVSRAKPGQ